jgi:hypothetical protein
MLRLCSAASLLLVSVSLGSAMALADDDYYMLIGDSWELGKVIADAQGTEQFVTCPGGERYQLDKKNLKQTNDPCDGDSRRFAVIEKGWDANAKQFTARMDDGETKTWTTDDPSQLQGLGVGSEVFLAPSMPLGDNAEVFRIIKPNL